MRRALFTASATLALLLQVSAQTTEVKVLHNFGSSNDGNVPSGSLLIDSSGSLYGATGGGPGEYGYGTVFELAPQANGEWAETIVHAFTGGSGGSDPWGAPLFDTRGNLYFTVQGYGSADIGGIFSFTPGTNGWTYSVPYTGGAGPGLLMDRLGNLYGAIGLGDYFGLGAIGELSPVPRGWTYTQLYSFTCQPSCADGYGPPAPPIWDSRGNLWGVTTYGGISDSPCVTEEGCGVIFVMTPDGDGAWTYHVIHRFASSPTDGQFPLAGLALDSEGNFYGDTDGGGTHGLGIIFRFSVTDGKVQASVIHNFSNCSTGCYPEGTLAIDSAGNLYGMAQGGPNSCGGPSCGVVFKLAPQANGTWKYSVLVNLTETTGGVLPFYGLILDSKGNLYGVTSSGGQYGGGTAFEISP
jgi:uncharacterized repeat protein (TIGR03803 family)